MGARLVPQNPAVTAVIPGCKSPEQARAIAAAATLDIGQTGHLPQFPGARRG